MAFHPHYSAAEHLYFAAETWMKLKRLFYGQISKSTEQSPSWESTIFSASRQIPRTSSNPLSLQHPHVPNHLQFSSQSAIRQHASRSHQTTKQYCSTVINVSHLCVPFLMYQLLNGYIPLICWIYSEQCLLYYKVPHYAVFTKLHKCNHTTKTLS